nr:DUF6476 family protein [uncultured Celeribacter sp.]
MTDPIDIDPKAAAGLTLLRRLVTGLLVVMIAGFLVLIGLLVTRFPKSDSAVAFEMPDRIHLPKGIQPEAFTRGNDWLAIVAGDEILIYDAESGSLRQRIDIRRD